MLLRRQRAISRPPRLEHWWSRAFLRSVGELGDDDRVAEEAMALARSGRLGAVLVLPGAASATVDPGTPSARLAQVRCERFTDADRRGFVEVAASRTDHADALERGRLSSDLVEELEEAGIELLPDITQLTTACDCGAWAQPCAHALALLHQLVWRLDADPWVLLMLRGQDADSLLGALVAGSTLAHLSAVARDAAAARARRILELSDSAPTGHGLADPEVAAYDEEISRLLRE